MVKATAFHHRYCQCRFSSRQGMVTFACTFSGVDEFAPTAAVWEDLVSIEHGLEDPGALELYGKPAPGAPADAVDFYDDPIHLYFREIGRVDLLTAKEERSLAGKVEDGRYLAALEKYCRANPDQYDLETRIIIASLRKLVFCPPGHLLLYTRTWGLSAGAVSNRLFSGRNCGPRWTASWTSPLSKM